MRSSLHVWGWMMVTVRWGFKGIGAVASGGGSGASDGSSGAGVRVARPNNGHGNNNNNDVPPNNNNVIVTSRCKRWRRGGLRPWAALWRASLLGSTLRTSKVYWACGWSSYLSNSLDRCAVGLHVDAGAARFVRWRRLPPQLHVSRKLSLPQSKWR